MPSSSGDHAALAGPAHPPGSRGPQKCRGIQQRNAEDTLRYMLISDKYVFKNMCVRLYIHKYKYKYYTYIYIYNKQIIIIYLKYMIT
jgi:hypothetical protein